MILLEKSMTFFSIAISALLLSFQVLAADISITAQEASELVKTNKATLIDVREVNEAEQGMATSAQLLPLSKIEANAPEWQKFLKDTPKNKTIVTYCRSGRRSGIVTQKLLALGYQVKNMGGFEGWMKAQLPTKKYSK